MSEQKLSERMRCIQGALGFSYEVEALEGQLAQANEEADQALRSANMYSEGMHAAIRERERLKDELARAFRERDATVVDLVQDRDSWRRVSERLEEEKKTAIRERDEARDGVAHAYQFAGANEAPVELLDNYSAVASGEPAPHPWTPAEPLRVFAQRDALAKALRLLESVGMLATFADPTCPCKSCTAKRAAREALATLERPAPVDGGKQHAEN